MSEELKLNCPMCNKEFITTRRDKIWCDKGCSNRFREVKKSIENNYRKNELIKNNAYHYDLDKDKFSIKSLMNNK